MMTSGGQALSKGCVFVNSLFNLTNGIISSPTSISNKATFNPTFATKQLLVQQLVLLLD